MRGTQDPNRRAVGIGEAVSLSGLSWFLSQRRCSTTAVVQIWWQLFCEWMAAHVPAEHARLEAERMRRVGCPKRTVVTGYLVFDDSVHTKPKGRAMGGLGRHYANTERTVVTGPCLLNGLSVLLGQRCSLEPRMYCQQRVCEAEGQPFHSKMDLVVVEIAQFVRVAGTPTHVLVDSWYHCRKVRRAAQQRGWEFGGSLKGNRVMRKEKSDGTREWLALSAHAATLTRDQWVEVTCPTEEGDKPLCAHLFRT